MKTDMSIIGQPDRANLHFERKVRVAFKFLEDIGFVEVEALPTLVRYFKTGVEVDVYHGRQSYEVGAGITGFGTRYAMSEIIRASDQEAAKRYRSAVVTKEEGLAESLEELSLQMKRYGIPALQGNSEFFSSLNNQRKQWLEEYALDVLAEQLRPQAHKAFQRGDYSIAVELFSRIQARLSTAELKKMAIAKARAG